MHTMAIKIILVFFGLHLLTGCGLFRVVRGGSPEDPALPVEIAIESPENLPKECAGSNGSLWNQCHSRSFFFQDTKARSIGDIVTVRVIENASGSKDAKTSTARKSSLSTATSALFGAPANTLTNLGAGSEFSNAFDGDGSTSRSGSLKAEVTAVVSTVFPNGNMKIEGRREVSINNEEEYLSVSGIIRPEDIGPGNTVLSTVIADAKIEYSGHGVINDKQRAGWLMRFVDLVWPF